MEISAKLNQANGRLKASKIGVTILQRGDRLYLQAVLPPRPGSRKSSACQQQIALKIQANPAGLSLAEREARKVGYLRDAKEFSWELYDRKAPHKSETIADWLAKFEQSKRAAVSLTTWTTDYARPFNQLPADEVISAEVLLDAIVKTEPNTRQRRRFCLAFRQLAQFADIGIDLGTLMGSYSPTQVQPRQLPSDEEVARVFERIENPQWQWIYGILAAYGLRDHEAFYIDLSKFPIIQVLEGKTGYRQCWPLRPEWAEQWDLVNVKRPPVTGACHADYGARVCKFFARLVPASFRAYDLRHAWAIRAIRMGLEPSLAAKQMGHSLNTHTQTYHLALNEQEQQRAYDLLVARSKT